MADTPGGPIPEWRNGQEVVKPLTVALKTALTVVIPEDDGAMQADIDIAAMKDGRQVLRTQASEMYFHQLRLRVVQEPDLAKSITVIYRRVNGDLLPVGLHYDDELRWPVGFLNAAWAKETEIRAARTASSPDPDPGDRS